MPEKSILFSGPMVRAILDGRKTQTRRILKPQPEERLWAIIERHPHQIGMARWSVGDTLWVRETWAVDAPLDQVRREHEDMMPGVGHGPYYRADPVHENAGLTWRTSIYMPRWASRITLQVVDVRVQRLQSISCADAIAEGIRAAANNVTIDCDTPDPRKEYAMLWNEINGAGSWDANPWVVALTFKRELPNA